MDTLRHRMTLFAIALVTLAGGCKDKTPGADTSASASGRSPVLASEQPAPGKERGSSSSAPLFTAEEIQVMEDRVMAEVRANRARVCNRPVLRGEPISGPGDAAIIDLLVPQKALAQCDEYVQTNRAALQDDLRHPAPEGAASQALARARDEPQSQERITEIAAQCSETAEALSRAVRHEDACSPVLPGRGTLPSAMTLVRLGWTVSALTRGPERADDPLSAAQFVLDYIRLTQDVARGGASLIEAMVAFAGMRVVIPELYRLVNDSRLTAADRATLAAEVDMLLASEVHPVGFGRGEYVTSALQQSLPLIKGPRWVPPGGVSGAQIPPSDQLAAGAGGEGLSPAQMRETAALTMRIWERMRTDIETICSANSSLRECYEGMKAHGEKLAAAKQPTVDATALAAMAAEERRIRQQEIKLDIMRAVASPAIDRYVRNHAWRSAALIAARIALDVREGRCPARPGAGVEQSQLGEKVMVKTGKGGMVIDVPAWLESKDERPLLLVVPCR